MDIETFRNYCLSKPGTEDCLPFGPDTLVFKVAGKMFALTSLSDEHFSVNLKCNPERALELREKYEEVKPGFHMNKKHWNTIDFGGRISEQELVELIDHSYELVVQSLTKAQRIILDGE